MSNTAIAVQSKIKVRNKVYKVISSEAIEGTSVLTLRTLTGKSDNQLIYLEGQDFAMWHSSRSISLKSPGVALDLINALGVVV